MRMDNAHTYACAAALTLNKDESGHNIGASLCAPDEMRDVCQMCGLTGVERLDGVACPVGPRAGGGLQCRETPGAIVRKGTNQEREVEPPTLTVSAARPSIDELRELLSYDPLSGVLRWRVSPARRVAVGDEAGSRNNSRGYRRIKLRGWRPLAHRVAWALFYGEWPQLKLDHKNGVTDDNRIVNLRLATNGQNKANSIAQSKYGVKGVCRERNGRWRAQIWRDGALRGLGAFDTMEEAARAFAVEHRRLHGEFSFTGAVRPTVSASIIEPNRASTGDELSHDGMGNPHNVAARGLQCPPTALEAPPSHAGACSNREGVAARGVRC